MGRQILPRTPDYTASGRWCSVASEHHLEQHLPSDTPIDPSVARNLETRYLGFRTMKAVLQRVTRAEVRVDDVVVGIIGIVPRAGAFVWFVAGVFGLSISVAREAHANGRFPNAQQVRELAPGSLVVAGTYGLLLTTNGGNDFSYVCELEIFGASALNVTLDPLLEVAPGGAFVTGSALAARVALGGGCGFETIGSLPRNFRFLGEEPPPGAEAGRIIDLCRRGTGTDAPLLALAALVGVDGIPFEHRIYEATSGTEFSPIGVAIPTDLMEFGVTLDAAPSDPERLYLTGILANEPVLARSSDGGRSWEAMAIPAADAVDVVGIYLAAVSPSDPNRIYVRTSRRRRVEFGYQWDDSMLVSDDAGDSFSEPLRRDAAMLGFALWNGGETVLAGYGEPRGEPTMSAPDAIGIYAADASAASGELAFERIVSDLDVNCLYVSPTGLYACASELDPLGVDPTAEPDFHLGIYRGVALPESRADFTPLAKFRDVRGPLPWSDGRAGACDMEWIFACAQFNACENDPRSLDEGALVCGGGTEQPGTAGEPANGCGCRSAGNAGNVGLGGWFAFLLVWWHRFHPRWRRSNS